MSKKSQSNISYLLTLAGKNKILLFISAIFSILGALCSFIPFFMVYNVLTFLFNKNINTNIALKYGIVAMISIGCKFLFMIISGVFSHIGAFNTLYNVRSELSQHIAKLNLGFFSSNTLGEIKKVIIEDVERIEKFLAHQIPDVVAAVLGPIIIFSYLLTLNIPLSITLLIPLIIGILIQIIAMKISGKQMEIYHKLLKKLNSTILQFINGMPVMKAYNMTADSYDNYSQTVHEYNIFWKQCTKDRGYTYGIFITLVESGILFIIPVGGFLFFKNKLNVQTYLFFMIMSMVFLSSLLNLINFGYSFMQISSGIDHIKLIMDLEEESCGDIIIDKNNIECITFNNVSFSYDNREVLNDININIPSGTLTAFVGMSGAGKTTAAQLIPKFWKVANGSITINEININEIQSSNLMDIISFVFQETFILNDSIYENIAIGNTYATKESVENAARSAQIHDFILSLPDGYNTKLGENGIKLSGGEQQRICIARAILKDAPIIIFDEATSYTDIENEHKIQLALGNLLKGKTTIMIAHRLHTIINADKICVFHKGKITEVGSHYNLLSKNGMYKHMWDVYTSSREEVI
ncbi:ABC transporter ATP-binding protein [Fusobacterium sp. PH5-44]|uniref:ABC transporter ATP-binding protein n=1 Tax=unclassified Fusobacterium TaxID=2648384 RepID=UPI003D1B01AD